MENLITSSPPLVPSDHDHFTFPYSSSQQYGSYMELLGLHDFTPYHYYHNSLLDDEALLLKYQPPKEVLLNQPATPNASSSISSASSEAAIADLSLMAEAVAEGGDKEEEEQGGEEEAAEEEEQKSKNKAVKGNKQAKEKKQREPRIAFMTKSEVDHLEDGYRWRKYGQKAVKNSSFPRSYYRCTTSSCNVKKRVERSHVDPEIVVTTYEGQHTHPSPLLMPRHSSLLRRPTLPEFSAFSPELRSGGPYYMNSPNNYVNNLASLMMRSGQALALTPAAGVGKRRLCPSGMPGLDHGLLEDVVPSHVLKEEQ